MKKAWKWLLAAVGVPAACFGLLAADSYYRAIAAIAAHDARLAADIATLRSKQKPSPVPLPPPKEEDASATFEQGHPSHYEYWNRARFERRSRDLVVGNTMDHLILSLALNQEVYREGGYQAFVARSDFENDALKNLQGFLHRRQPDLRRLATVLDQLAARRISAADVATGEYLLDRAQVLSVLHKKEDPYCMLRQKPGWREFFSWRILIAKALNQLEDRYRSVLLLQSIQGPEHAARMRGDDRLYFVDEDPGSLTRSVLMGNPHGLYSRELRNRAQWTLTRVACAMMVHYREQGRFPEKLVDLVPGVLSEVPRSPYDGAELRFIGGHLSDSAAGWGWSLPPE